MGTLATVGQDTTIYDLGYVRSNLSLRVRATNGFGDSAASAWPTTTCVTYPGHSCPEGGGLPPNLATNKPATQSSTYYGYYPADASLAVDNNTNGDFNGVATSAATYYEYQPWWQVDLGGSQPIGTVYLWPRTDCCVEHLANFYVLVSDQPFPSNDLATLLNQPESVIWRQSFTGYSSSPTRVEVNHFGRYVRVQRTDSQYLILSEVQVYPANMSDMVLNALAVSQSSTYIDNGVTFSSDRAVDGNTSGDFWGSSSVSATNSEYQPRWEVDLGSSQPIRSIKMWPRTDCCLDHTANYYVLVSDAPFVSTDLAAARNPASVSSYYISGDAGAPVTINLERTGRYVRVQRADSQYLVLGEVQVWGMGKNVVWAVADGVSVSQNSLTKTAGEGWNTGASSAQAITSGDGYVEFTVEEANTYKMCGLGGSTNNQDFSMIDYALYPSAGGGLHVYERGVYRGQIGSYVPGDRLRVSIEGGVVKYHQNGNLLYMSSVPPTYPLMAGASLYSSGATINNVVISGNLR